MTLIARTFPLLVMVLLTTSSYAQHPVPTLSAGTSTVPALSLPKESQSTNQVPTLPIGEALLSLPSQAQQVLHDSPVQLTPAPAPDAVSVSWPQQTQQASDTSTVQPTPASSSAPGRTANKKRHHLTGFDIYVIVVTGFLLVIVLGPLGGG